MLALSACVILDSAYARAGQQGFWISANTDTYSSIMPIAQLLDDLQGSKLDKGTYAYSHSQIEIGERRENLELVLLTRMDDSYEFSEDTASYLYLDKNDLTIPDANYNLRLEADSLRAIGIGAGYHIKPNDRISSRIGINYLYAKKMTDGTLRGTLDASKGEISGNLSLDYTYSEDRIFDRVSEGVTGHGLTLDFDIEAEINDRYTLAFQARDLVSRIYWNKQTYTEAQSVTRLYNLEDGSYLSIPGLERYERNRNHIQSLPSRIYINNQFMLNEQLSASVNGFWYNGNFQPLFGAKFTSDRFIYSAGLNAETRAISLGIGDDQFTVTLGVDNIDPELTKAITAKAELRF